MNSYEIGYNIGSMVGMALYWVFYIGIFVLAVIAMWKMFEKAGEPGWAAIIPFYNNYVLCKIAGKTKLFWWQLGLTVAFVVSMVVVWFAVLYSVITESRNFAGILGIVVILFVLYFAFLIALLVIKGFLCGALARSFGESTGFAVGLFFVPIIFYCIIGFSKKYQYCGPNGIYGPMNANQYGWNANQPNAQYGYNANQYGWNANQQYNQNGFDVNQQYNQNGFDANQQYSQNGFDANQQYNQNGFDANQNPYAYNGSQQFDQNNEDNNNNNF